MSERIPTRTDFFEARQEEVRELRAKSMACRVLARAYGDIEATVGRISIYAGGEEAVTDVASYCSQWGVKYLVRAQELNDQAETLEASPL